MYRSGSFRVTFPSPPPSHPNSWSLLSSFSSILKCHIQWALIELARNLDVQDTLRAELQSELGATDDSGCGQHVNALPYLDAFASEVLRTHPSVPELTREVCSCNLYGLLNLLFIFYPHRPMSTIPSHSPAPSALHLASSSTASSLPRALPSASPSLASTCQRNCGEGMPASLTRTGGWI